MFRKLKQFRYFLWRTKEIYKRAKDANSLGKNWRERMLNSLKVNLKDTADVVGELDYPKKNIKIDVSSYILVKRLQACKKEPETVRWIEEYVKPGDFFYDIGANIGAYSLIAWGATDGKAAVYAFEPSFSSYATLCKNIYLNQCSNLVKAFPIAFANANELPEFNYSSIEPSRAKHYVASGGNLPHEGVNYSVFKHPVIGMRLDDFIRMFGAPVPNHIKIDVDGGELELVRGAEKTLSDPRLHSVFIEIYEKRSGSDEVKNRLRQAGFSEVAHYPASSQHPSAAATGGVTVFLYARA